MGNSTLWLDRVHLASDLNTQVQDSRFQEFPHIVITSNVLQTAGIALNFIVLATVVISSRVHRLTTWFMIQFSIIFYCLCMLALALGSCQIGPKPPTSLCLFQAVMLEAAPVWVSWVVAAYALDMYLVSRGFVGLVNRHQRMYKFWLIAAPVTLASTALIVALGTALRFLSPHEKFGKGTKPNDIQLQIARDTSGVVCRASRKTTGHIFSLVLAAVGTGLAFLFAVLIARLLVRRGWLREIDAGPTYGTITRWTVARLFCLISCSASILGLPEFDHRDQIRGSPDTFKSLSVGEEAARIVLAAIPLLIGTGLAAQKDILSVWRFWRKNKTGSETTGSDEDGKSLYYGTTTKFLSLTTPISA